MAKQYKKVIMCLGDWHAPEAHMDAIEQAAEAYKYYKKNAEEVIVVQMGDATDQKAWSRFGKDTDDYSPQEEWDLTLSQLHEIARIFPTLTILLGNHDLRAIRKATEVHLPRQLIKSLDEVISIPGWTWHLEPKPLVIDDIIFMHGDEMAGDVAQKARRLGKSIVQGHSHQGHINHIRTFQHAIFAMDVGCMADPTGKGARYAIRNPQTCFIGFGVIVDGVPLLIPYKEKK